MLLVSMLMRRGGVGVGWGRLRGCVWLSMPSDLVIWNVIETSANA